MGILVQYSFTNVPSENSEAFRGTEYLCVFRKLDLFDRILEKISEPISVGSCYENMFLSEYHLSSRDRWANRNVRIDFSNYSENSEMTAFLFITLVKTAPSDPLRISFRI